MVAWKIAKDMDFVKTVFTESLVHHARDSTLTHVMSLILGQLFHHVQKSILPPLITRKILNAHFDIFGSIAYMMDSSRTR